MYLHSSGLRWLLASAPFPCLLLHLISWSELLLMHFHLASLLSERTGSMWGESQRSLSLPLGHLAGRHCVYVYMRLCGCVCAGVYNMSACCMRGVVMILNYTRIKATDTKSFFFLSPEFSLSFRAHLMSEPGIKSAACFTRCGPFF